MRGITNSTQLDVKEYGYFAGNQWRKTEGDQVFEVHEPYSGKLFARVSAGTRADARTAVDAAAKAFPAWAETTPAEKARLFLKASEIVKRRRTEIAEVLARETGSTISFATFQQDLVAGTLQRVAGWVYLPKGEVLETNAPGRTRSACGVRWASSPVSRHGMAPTSFPGEPSYRPWLPETPSRSSRPSSLPCQRELCSQRLRRKPGSLRE
jgi:hypothetical protein